MSGQLGVGRGFDGSFVPVGFAMASGYLLDELENPRRDFDDEKRRTRT
jgi:hypothetical protein